MSGQLEWMRLGTPGVWSCARGGLMVGCLFFDDDGLGWWWVDAAKPEQHLPVPGTPSLEDIAVQRTRTPSPAAAAAMEEAQHRYIDPVD